MKSRLVILALLVGMTSLLTAEPETTKKQGEILKLIHYTKELQIFRERVKGMVENVRKNYPDSPAWYWEELEREPSADSYAQWLVEVFSRHLSEDDLRELITIFSDPTTKELVEALVADLQGKHGEDFVRTVKEFQQTHDRERADVVVKFMLSEAARKYGQAKSELNAGDREFFINELDAATKRIRARHP